MSLMEAIRKSMAEISGIEIADGGVRVTTHCMYPSNSFVQVLVSGGVHTCFASDEGRALREIESAGIDVKRPDRKVQHLVASQGLRITNGAILSPSVPITHSAAVIALVANASRDVANWLYDHAKVKRTRDFRRLLRDYLNSTFDDRVHHDERIVGSSNKTHKFENIIALGDNRKLIVDPVNNDPSSINARVVANLDVRTAEHPGLEQRIVYDDDADWSAADLNLLGVGAIVVPFSKSPTVIKRLASASV